MYQITVGPPATGGSFYNRKELVEHLWQELNRGSVLLVAPRRFGKTSVMLHLRDKPRTGYHPIFLDVESLETPAQFVTEVIGEMARALPGFRRVLSDIKGLPQNALNFLKDNVSEVEVTEFKIKLRETVAQEWFDRGKQLIELAEQIDGRALLLIDELPLMLKRMLKSEEAASTERFLHWLRSFRQEPNAGTSMRFVMGGSIGIEHVLKQAEAVASMNDLQRVLVEPFSADNAHQFIAMLFKSQGSPVNEEVIQRAIQEVEVCVPFFLQLLVQETCKLARDKGITITPDLVSEAYHERLISVESRTYFESFYTRLRDYYGIQEERAAKAILRELALAEELTETHLRAIYTEAIQGQASESFSDLLSDLENDFYLQRHNGAYRFHTKVLRDWWVRFYRYE